MTNNYCCVQEREAAEAQAELERRMEEARRREEASRRLQEELTEARQLVEDNQRALAEALAAPPAQPTLVPVHEGGDEGEDDRNSEQSQRLVCISCHVDVYQDDNRII